MIGQVGEQFSRLRHSTGETAESLARAIGIPLTCLQGIERGRVAQGATLTHYLRYAEHLKASLTDIFVSALSQEEKSHAEQLEEELLDRIGQAIEQLEGGGLPITQRAVGQLVGMSPQGLKRYPRVRAVLEQIAADNRQQRSINTEVRIQRLLHDMTEAADQLQAQRQPVTGRAISAAMQISWSSLRSHARVRSLLKDITRK